MIQIELQIKCRDLTPEQEEQFRTHVRHSTLAWIFKEADFFGQLNRIDFSHHSLGVTGDIKQIEDDHGNHADQAPDPEHGYGDSAA